MPTIQFPKKDLEALLGRSMSVPKIEKYLAWVKGEIKDYQEETDELRVELNDTNRPDLWCVEGIARQIRYKLTPQVRNSFSLKKKSKAPFQILVEPGTKAIRPYIGGCVAKGLLVDDQLLLQFIQTQEKLADLYGRKRESVSIGLYRLEKISFPVTYTVAEPSQVSFIPLNCDFKMTLAEILKNHPKGQEYGFILEGTHRYPLLIDQKQQVLSFPPIINSRDLGEVKAGDQNLLVEVTGTDLRMVALTINIWAANLSDRGASIESVEVVYPEKTVFGKKVRMPFSFSKPLCVSLTDIDKAFAERFQTKEVMGLLKGFGHLVKLKGKKLEVTAPPYRDDLMHPVDVIEEVAISRGYDQFKPELPPHFTVGDLSKEEKCSDWVRTFLIGMGFQEMNSNILCSREEIVERMQLDGGGVVEVDNIMSETYAVLRDSLLPSLLKVEAASSKAFYPHQIFEVGEVVRKTHPEDDPVTQVNLGALVAHPGANFSETHTYLEMLFYYMNCVYDLEPISHPSFLEGRVGRIRIEGKGVGFLGEIHPEVLDRWGILTPCSAFEVSLGEFF